jgi:phage terminase small subunit
MKPQTKKEKPYQLLTPRQEQFCHEYLKDRNGTQAAIRAGYSPKTAQEQASRLLSKVMIRAKINQLIREQLDRIKIKADFIVRELLNTATINLRDAYDQKGNLLPIEDMPEPLQKAIAEIKTEELFDGRGEEREHIGTAKTIKIADRLRALELLGKHLKMFTDVHEIPGLESLAEAIKQARMRTKDAKDRRGHKG